MRLMVRLFFVCLVIPVLAGARILPEWQQALNMQMLTEHDCEVNALSNVRLGVKDGKESISARVHCTDNRAFDVTRTGRDPYKVEQCGPVAC